MPTLRLVGSVILGIFVVAIFIAGYTCFSQISARAEAREAAEKMRDAVGRVMGTGNGQWVELRIPAGYTMSFGENRISIDGITFALDCPIRGPKLDGGSHRLYVGYENLGSGFGIVVEAST